MSDDPRTLADRLAAVRHYECGDCWYSCPESDEGCCNDGDEGCTCWAPLCHEAAALLRRHADLLDAIGDPDILWYLATVRREDRYYLRRIADAVDGST